MTRKTGRRRRRSGSRPLAGMWRLRSILVLVVGLSLYQFLDTGQVRWPVDAYHKVTGTLAEYIGRPGASWKKAGDVIEDLGAAREGQHPSEFDLVGRVVRVADGDTLSLLDGSGQQHKIRLFGIDTPEREQRYGKTAHRALDNMVAGKTVGVIRVEVDDYGRTVGTVYLQNRNINLTMVEQGHAWWYRRYAAYERHLAEAEQVARRDRKGLWSYPRPQAPWDWRRTHRQ